MSQKFVAAAAIGAAVLALSAGPAQAETRSHSAHEHGAGQLNVVFDGSELQVELVLSAMDAVGFEHAPDSDIDHAAVNKALALLRDGNKLLQLPAAASCELHESEAEREALGDEPHKEHAEKDHDEHDEEHHDEHAAESAEHSSAKHSEFHAHWHFECAKPSALDALEVSLFDYFNTAELRVQAITPGGQTSLELTPASRRLPLR